MHITRILAATAAAAALGVAGMAPATAAADPKANNPAYWEQGGLYDCTKVEFGGDLKSYTVPAGSGFVVIKAGTENIVVQMDPFTEQVIQLTRGVSHVITCDGYDGGS